MKVERQPKGWPSGITYIHRCVMSKSVSSDLLAPSERPNEVVKPTLGPCPHVRISPIKDPTHPANGQYGLFAAKQLPPGSLIILYLGLVHAKAEADPLSDYDLSLSRELELGVDASTMGNEARFINDYRGVAARPNAEFKDVWVELSPGQIEQTMAIYVLGAGKSQARAKGIQKHEEIVVSYGKGFWDERRKQG